MEIDILRIAELSNLSISKDELSRFSAQMGDIIEMISDLPEWNCEAGLEKSEMVLREDEICDSMPFDKAVSNAPKAFEGCFVVPHTVD